MCNNPKERSSQEILSAMMSDPATYPKGTWMKWPQYVIDHIPPPGADAKASVQPYIHYSMHSAVTWARFTSTKTKGMI